MTVKRIFAAVLSAVMAFGTMGSLAFAKEAPKTIVAPNGEVMEIPTVEVPDVPMSAQEEPGKTYPITTQAEFEAITWEEWWASGNNVFEIYCDLDFSETPIDEWSGVIEYFQGHIVGMKTSEDDEYPIISGIPSNCAFIYGNMGGTIENLIFNHNEKAAYVSLYPVNGGDDPSITLKNITVNGNITLNGADQSNYSPFIYSAGNGNFTMDNCVNNADISGNIYGGIFYGYYPLYPEHTYTFTNCTNTGDVTMNYAGMFFGNDSDLNGRLNQMELTIANCENKGIIRGITAAAYLAAPVSGSFTPGSNAQQVENALVSGGVCKWNVSKITQDGGTITSGTKEGDYFSAEVKGNDIIITPTDNSGVVDHYDVSVGGYLNIWYVSRKEFLGSALYTVNQTVHPADVTEDNTIVPELKVYGFADSDVDGTYGSTYNYITVTVDGNTYYMVDNETEYYNEFNLYVSSETNKDTPVGGGMEQAAVVTVAAYDANNNILGISNPSL